MSTHPRVRLPVSARALVPGKYASVPHARMLAHNPFPQANPSLDLSEDDKPVIDLIDAQYLLYAVAKKYRFLADATLEQRPPLQGGASDDMVMRVQVMRPETTGLAVATPTDVDVLMELRSNALAEAVSQQGEQLLSFSVGSLASTARSSQLGACPTTCAPCGYYFPTHTHTHTQKTEA